SGAMPGRDSWAAPTRLLTRAGLLRSMLWVRSRPWTYMRVPNGVSQVVASAWAYSSPPARVARGVLVKTMVLLLPPLETLVRVGATKLYGSAVDIWLYVM